MPSLVTLSGVEGGKAKQKRKGETFSLILYTSTSLSVTVKLHSVRQYRIMLSLVTLSGVDYHVVLSEVEGCSAL